jgi:hypothetical protein
MNKTKVRKDTRISWTTGMEQELAELLKQVGDEQDKKSGKQKRLQLIEKMYDLGISGDTKAADLVMNREFGKVTEKLQFLKPDEVNYDNLTDDELNQLIALVKKMQGEPNDNSPETSQT